MESLSVDVSLDGDRGLLQVRGELDEATAERMQAVDVEGLASSGCRDLRINLSDLEFMDSSGIGSLVNLRNRAAACNVSVTVDAAPAPIHHTLTVAGLAGLFGLR